MLNGLDRDCVEAVLWGPKTLYDTVASTLENSLSQMYIFLIDIKPN